MSKLEDKLAASIKPSPRKVPEETSTAAKESQAKPRRTRTRTSAPESASAAVVPESNDTNRHLHPDRIWPD